MFIRFDALSVIFIHFYCSHLPPPPPMFCGVSNNDVFSSFTESMTHAHDHYWIYGGSRPGLRMLIRGETNAEECLSL